VHRRTVAPRTAVGAHSTDGCPRRLRWICFDPCRGDFGIRCCGDRIRLYRMHLSGDVPDAEMGFGAGDRRGARPLEHQAVVAPVSRCLVLCCVHRQFFWTKGLLAGPDVRSRAEWPYVSRRRSGPMMKTLFLHPPSFDGFDGGAGSRYQAKREIRSFWYPTWLAQPAALVPDSRLIDAPPARLKLPGLLSLAADYELAVLHTSPPSFPSTVRRAEALKDANPKLKIGFVGAKVAVEPEDSLRASNAVDFVAREEFDFTVKEVAEGRSYDAIDGLSYRGAAGDIVHNRDRAVLED